MKKVLTEQQFRRMVRQEISKKYSYLSLQEQVMLEEKLVNEVLAGVVAGAKKVGQLAGQAIGKGIEKIGQVAKGVAAGAKEAYGQVAAAASEAEQKAADEKAAKEKAAIRAKRAAELKKADAELAKVLAQLSTTGGKVMQLTPTNQLKTQFKTLEGEIDRTIEQIRASNKALSAEYKKQQSESEGTIPLTQRKVNESLIRRRSQYHR